MNNSARLIILLALVGIVDAGYLTVEHFRNVLPICEPFFFFIDCGKVLRSPYAVPFGVPLALIGLVHYTALFLSGISGFLFHRRWGRFGVFILSVFGFFSSLVFVYLQLAVIGATCLYCMGSAVVSFAIFFLALRSLSDERNRLTVFFLTVFYVRCVKPFLFRIPPETVHERMLSFGEMLGAHSFSRICIAWTIAPRHGAILSQTLCGMTFDRPIGLAAGFDYQAKLPGIVDSLGFGFATVGTLTHLRCEGNPPPRLGRLPRSRSLMVNKGFKNPGIAHVVSQWESRDFSFPLGVSIGMTNSKTIRSRSHAISDILSAFAIAEQGDMRHAYYEVNISCPNLHTDVHFTSARALSDLFSAIDALHLRRPVFVKMPIGISDATALDLLRVLAAHCPQGVIFGNLQKDRTCPELDPEEVRAFRVGNFSGRPTFRRSNELLRLAYRRYSDRFVFIGCGGVFDARDAYEKIRSGASCVQLITGLVFRGPQVVSDIQNGLVDFLRRDGYTHISQAIGTQTGGAVA